jgi:lysophospholipase L1-like esterase
VRALVAGQRRREETLNRYTYDVEEVTERLDDEGGARKVETRRYEVFHVKGRPAQAGGRERSPGMLGLTVMPGRAALALFFLALLLPACGGGGSSTSPTPPTTTPVARAPVTVVVFYDEDGDGEAGASEVVRVPGIDVVIGDATAKTGTGGRAVVQAPLGAQTVALRTESLPAFYQPPAPLSLSVPTPDEVLLPLTLPIGERRPNVYMAFGDSITVGEGSSDGTGYRNRLDLRLIAHLGTSDVVNEGRAGTQTDEGADRVIRALRRRNPAYTLIMYGTNDWNTIQCQKGAPCDTIDEMTSIIQQVEDFGSLPVLSTIIPANPARQPQERNDWVRAQNGYLQDLARSERIPLADPARLFFASSDLTSLFADAVHPNDAGYELIAQAFFEAITGARSSTVGASFGFPRP